MVILRTPRVLLKTLRMTLKTLRMTLKTLRAAKTTPSLKTYGTEGVDVVRSLFSMNFHIQLRCPEFHL
jgi:hypothetical protein